MDEDDIYSQPRLSSFEFLYRYRKNPKLDMRKLYVCASLFPGRHSFRAISAKLTGRASLHEIYTWIAFSYLKLDLNGSNLNFKTELEFNVDIQLVG